LPVYWLYRYHSFSCQRHALSPNARGASVIFSLVRGSTEGLRLPSLKYLRSNASRTPLRRPLVWLRNLGLDPNDQFLASYPRSGNTMLRFLLAEAITGVPSTFDNIQRTIPDIGVHVRATPFLPGGGRLIKTHERRRSSYHRAIYVIRDVRDVLLSNFGRETAMDAISVRNLDDFVRLFMQGKMSRWGTWQEHVAEWLYSPLARRGDLHLVRFEEMRKNPHGTIVSALEFLGLTVSSEAIQSAVTNNSLERMRAKEDNAGTLPKTTQERGRWIGQGSVHGWRQRLTPEHLKVVDAYAGEMLDRLGYMRAESLNQGSALGSPPKPITEPMAPSLPLPASSNGIIIPPAGTREKQYFRTPFQKLCRQIGGRAADTFSWYRH
jgi:hypothetical protein